MNWLYFELGATIGTILGVCLVFFVYLAFFGFDFGDARGKKKCRR